MSAEKRLPDSLWAATAPAAPETTSLKEAIAVDIAIVGAGYNGLRAALCLAEAGKNVVVVDAGDIGWGASGRNGGQVNPIGHEPPSKIAARWRDVFDPSYTERFTRGIIESADELFTLVKKYNINCDAEQNGWIRAIHAPSAEAEFRAMYEGWSDAGADLRLIEQDELHQLSGCSGYGKGWVSSQGGSVQPLAYARGLARAAFLQTAGGEIKADQVVLSTNGYTDSLWTGLQQSVVPIVSIQAATEPLSAEQEACILPERHTFADTRRVIYYFKKTADQRLVFGSAGFAGDNPQESDLQRVRDGIATVYPFLKNVSIDYLWGGRIAITQDHLPHIHNPAPGLWIGLGCNGRGVAMSTLMGRLLAELVQGADPNAQSIPVTEIKTFPFHRFHRIGAKMVLHWREFQDRRESRARR